MNHARAFASGTALALSLSLVGCGDASPSSAADEGSLQLALTKVPADAGCLRVSISGDRAVSRDVDLVTGSNVTVTIDRLPVGLVTVDARAFPSACRAVAPASVPTYVLEAPLALRIDPLAILRVALRLLHNGRVSFEVDFEDAASWYSASRTPVTMAIIGDTPYGAPQATDFPNFVAHINADPAVSEVVHLGDIKNGSTRCDDSYFQKIATDFAGFADPLVYTPGDNEWTDCHRANNGAYDPLERLDAVRKVYFPAVGKTLGSGSKRVLSQATVPGFETFVENVLWERAGVLFAAVHVVGSNNGLLPWYGDDTTGTKVDDPARRAAEEGARSAAAVHWLKVAFALAKQDTTAGVVIMMQADTWDGGAPAGSTAFIPIIQTFAELARDFGRPVLLLQGDTHVYKTDNPLAAGDAFYGAPPVPNLTRVVVQGSNVTEWLRLTVDPANAAVFSWDRIMR